MPSKVSVGVVGTGGWGKNHVRVYNELKDLCSLKAICDVDRDRARTWGKKFGVDWYSSTKEILSRNDIDAFSICTPTAEHHAVAIKALELGKNLLVEKPLADSVNKAVQIYKMAQKSDLMLMVGLIERFNRAVNVLKRLVRGGELGKIRYFSAGRISKYIPTMRDRGVILDLATHDIDVIRYILEQEPTDVYAESRNLIPGHSRGCETNAEIFLKYPGDVTAHIISEWLVSDTNQGRIRQLQVTGSLGTALLSYIPQLVWKIDAVDIKSPFIDNAGHPNYSRDPRDRTLLSPRKWEEPLRIELESFLKTISKGSEPSVSGVDGIRVLEITEGALRSARSRSMKKLDYQRLR